MRLLILFSTFFIAISSYCQSTLREILEKSEEYYLRKAGGVVNYTERYKSFYLPDTFRSGKTFVWYNRGKERVAKEITEKKYAYYKINKDFYSVNSGHDYYEKENKPRSWEHIPHWNPINFFKPFYKSEKAGKLQVAQTDSNYTLLFIDQYQAHAIEVDKGNFRIKRSMQSTFTQRGTIYNESTFEETVDIRQPDSLYNDFAAMQATKRLLSASEAYKMRHREDNRLAAFEHKRISIDSLTKLVADSNETTINNQYILLDFFFQSCIPCIESIPDLNALNASVDAGKLKIIGVDHLLRDAGKSEPFINFHKISYKIVDGAKAEKIHQLFSNAIAYYPTLVLIKPDGEVVKIHIGRGPNTFNEIKNIVQPAL